MALGQAWYFLKDEGKRDWAASCASCAEKDRHIQELEQMEEATNRQLAIAMRHVEYLQQQLTSTSSYRQPSHDSNINFFNPEGGGGA